MMNRLLVACVGAGLTLIGGCTTVSREVIPPAEAIAETRIFTGDGTPTDWEALKLAAYNAEVVVIAEQHGHPIGLSTAAALWREVLLANQRKETVERAASSGLAREPDNDRSPALALEFFERDQAGALKAYQYGEIDEAEFLKRTGKASALTAEDPWSTGYPPGHRDMLEAAIAARAPVYPANAPRRFVRLVRTDGYAAISNLTAVEQLYVVRPRFANDPAPPDNKYWRDFLTFMDTTPEKYAAASAADKEKVDGMFRAQSVWDATMADTVLRELSWGRRPVFLVVGQFHADFASEGGGGTMQELKALRPSVRTIVVSFQDADPAGGFRGEDKGRADFVIYCGPHPAASK